MGFNFWALIGSSYQLYQALVVSDGRTPVSISRGLSFLLMATC